MFLKDIWPTAKEVRDLRASCISPEQFTREYGRVFDGNEEWNAVPISESDLYPWSDDSTYIQRPPFFDGMRAEPDEITPIRGARVLIHAGDSVTTDHISPAGAIPKDSPAGQYLIEHNVPVSMFNSFGSRRGNDRVMTRGTFGNIRMKNLLASENGQVREGWWTRDFSKAGKGAIAPTFDAATHYKAEKTPTIVLAGKDYGMGSSRDWAAKGTNLLGVRAVIAESFERIHRSNLVGMGVLPLVFREGDTPGSLGLDGTESYDISVPDPITPRCTINVTATKQDGGKIEFQALCRLDTPVEVDYYKHGGILQTVLRKILNESGQAAAV